MEIYLISPPEETRSFNADNFEKISELIPIKYFQFRPKFKLFEERKKFVEKFHSSFSKICKKKDINLIINDDFEIAKDFFLMEYILVKMIKVVQKQRKSLVKIF